MARIMASPPVDELHMDSLALPSGSRVPKAMIAAVAGFILLTTALYYFIKWICSRSSSSTTPADEIDVEKAVPASSKAASENIPEIAYAELLDLRKKDTTPVSSSSNLAAEVEDEVCSVCLTELSKSEKIKMLPGCKHAFHSSCIDMWLFSHASCPVCRARL